MNLFLSSAESTVTVGASADAALEERVAERAKAPAGQLCDVYFDAPGLTLFALVGALTVLEERGYATRSCGGASAGAIVAALVASGYTAAEIRQILLVTDFATMLYRGRSPLRRRRRPISLEYTRNWLRDLLASKGVTTFGDLKDPDGVPPGAWRLTVVVTSPELRRILLLPADGRLLGIDPDVLPVADAVAGSMSWPDLFEPFAVRNPQTGQEIGLTDGRYVPQYPVWIFDVKDHAPRWPTFGIRVVSDLHQPPEWAPTDDLLAHAEMEMASRTRMALDDEALSRTIAIPVESVPGVQSDLSRATALALYDTGRTAAEQFLTTWDFMAYQARYRKGDSHGG